MASAVMIRASYDEMAQVGESPESSVQLSAGGYLASLGVYHDLHCLVREASGMLYMTTSC
jgi:hypothetical protein